MIIKIITIIAVIILFYGNTLFNGFVHDDIWQIVENQDIRSFANLPKIFKGCVAEQILGTCHRASTYRPLEFVSYLFTYQISKDTWAFHLVNLLYTFILAILVFKFFQIIYGLRIRHSGEPSPHPSPLGRGGKKSSLSFWERARVRVDSGKIRMTALLATLFFLAHPINSEVINWAGGVPELLVAIFTIAMLLCYIKFSAHYSSSDPDLSGESRSSKFLIFSAILYTLGLLSKETALFALGLVFVYEIIFVGIKTKRKFLRKYFKTFTFYLVPTFLYLLIRANVLGRIVYKDEGFYSLSNLGQIINAIVLYPRYVIKLFYPLPLSLQHPFIPTIAIDGRVIFAVLFLLVNIALLYIAIRKRQKVLVFGFFFFAITLSPVLIFINKLGEFVFSERYLFLPSIGFTLIVFEGVRIFLLRHSGEPSPHPSPLGRGGGESSSPLGRGGKKSSLPPRENPKNSLSFWERARVRGDEPARPRLVGSRVFLCLFAAYLGISWFVVFNRNKDWKDNLSSYLSIVRAYPNNKKASAQAYTLLFKLSSKRFANKGVSFLYPKGWTITESKSCHFDPPAVISNPEGMRDPKGISLPTSRGRNDKGTSKSDSHCITIKTSDNTFTIEIRQDKKPAYKTVEEYLEKQTSSLGTKSDLGTLINQGPALIPNVDKAYVKIWQDSSTGSELSKMQFFLFKTDMVVEIRVWPSDSVFMRDFDEILRSLEVVKSRN